MFAGDVKNNIAKIIDNITNDKTKINRLTINILYVILKLKEHNPL